MCRWAAHGGDENQSVQLSSLKGHGNRLHARCERRPQSTCFRTPIFTLKESSTMKTTMKRSLLLLAGVCTLLAVTVATPGQALAAAAVQPLPTAWPRDFDSAQQRIELYQPQVEVWQGNRIEGRAAFAVGAKNATPNYGV